MNETRESLIAQLVDLEANEPDCECYESAPGKAIRCTATITGAIPNGTANTTGSKPQSPAATISPRANP